MAREHDLARSNFMLELQTMSFYEIITSLENKETGRRFPILVLEELQSRADTRKQTLYVFMRKQFTDEEAKSPKLHFTNQAPIAAATNPIRKR
jgi:hypothetical protein